MDRLVGWPSNGKRSVVLKCYLQGNLGMERVSSVNLFRSSSAVRWSSPFPWTASDVGWKFLLSGSAEALRRTTKPKVGTQHMIDEADLESLLEDEELAGPKAWDRMADGRPMPNVVRAIRLSRVGR